MAKSLFIPGPKNLITDVAGVLVGNAHDTDVRTGVTIIRPVEPALAAVDVRGGAPGVRESNALDPACLVNEVHAIVLSGGSAFGLDAAGAVMNRLAAEGCGFKAGAHCVPIVPQAILFDLANGGNKDWGQHPPYPRLAGEAFDALSDGFALGSAGAGYGATTANLAGGLGSASTLVEGRFTVGAIAAVNAVGALTIGNEGQFHAADFELNGEFGGRGRPAQASLDSLAMKGFEPAQNTTICVLATDLALPSEGPLQRVAIMAQDGLARAMFPAHSPMDGDSVFALSTRAVEPQEYLRDLALLGAAAQATMARACARAVYEAEKSFVHPTWQQRFGVLG